MRDDQATLVCSIPGCGAKLRRSNTIGRCQEHRYIPAERDVCAVDGCGQPLRKDNGTGYCKAHKFATDRVPVRTCAADGCDRNLRADNKSGYCTAHAEQTVATRAYRDRYYADLREQSAGRYQQRPVCSVDGCANRLRSDNTTGRCAEHIYVPLVLPVCAVDGCDNRLTARNATERCTEHRGEYWASDAPRCQADGCNRTLHADNRIGYCRKHRSLSPTRRDYNGGYYQRRQVELREYSRQYREVYAAEHRAYASAWNAANPEARQAAHARRRRRIRVAMDSSDRLLSALYRRAIRDDPCFYCGSPVTDHTDHFFPLAKGGTDHWFNLVRACEHCNCSKQVMCGTAFLLLSGG